MNKEDLEKIVGEKISEERMQTLYDITKFMESTNKNYEHKDEYDKNEYDGIIYIDD